MRSRVTLINRCRMWKRRPTQYKGLQKKNSTKVRHGKTDNISVSLKSEQRTGPNEQTKERDHRFRNYSNKRGWRSCNSLLHDELLCPYRKRDKDDDGKGGGDSSVKGNRRPQGCYHCGEPNLSFCNKYRQGNITTVYVEFNAQQHSKTLDGRTSDVIFHALLLYLHQWN